MSDSSESYSPARCALVSWLSDVDALVAEDDGRHPWEGPVDGIDEDDLTIENLGFMRIPKGSLAFVPTLRLNRNLSATIYPRTKTH